MMQLIRYQTEDGRVPFTEWLNGLRDKVAQARVRMRLRTAEAGNLGDSEPVGEGVIEMRVHVGAGYRVYYGRHGKNVVVLLWGGDKSTQQTDIKRAKDYFADWKRRQP